MWGDCYLDNSYLHTFCLESVAVALGRIVLYALGLQCMDHSDAIYCALVSLLFILGLFRILLWRSRC